MTRERVILVGLALILFLIPLPYGAVDEWAIFAFEAAVSFLFLLYAFLWPLLKTKGKEYGSEVAKKPWPKNWTEGGFSKEDKTPYNYLQANIASRIVFSLVIIFFVVSIVQIIPWPASVVRTLSPQKFAIHSSSIEIFEGSGSEGQKARFSPLSLVPALSRYEFLKYVGYFLFGFLLFKSCRSRREIQAIVLIMLAAGLFQAIYGLAEYLSGTGRIFGYTNIWGRGSAFGTFINRDHYAGFLEMIFPLSLGYLLARANFFALKKGVSLRQKIVWFSQERLQQTLLVGALTTVLGLGLLFSRSRSGVIIFLVIFFLMMLALSAGARQEREGKGERKQNIWELELGKDKAEDRDADEDKAKDEEMDEDKDENENVDDDMDEDKDENKDVDQDMDVDEDKDVDQDMDVDVDSSSSKLKKLRNSFSCDDDHKRRNSADSGFQSAKRGRGIDRRFQGNPGSKRMLRLIRTVALAVIFGALFIGLRPIIERFTLESFWREARPKFYDLTMRMISDFPLFGTGAGTYIYAYTPYESEDLHGILHHAHNDYLETLAEMGLIGGGAAILAAFLALGFLFWRWRQLAERDYFRRGIGLGLLGGIVAILIHSVSDFNLRVPANAVYFLSLYVLAWRLLHLNK